MSHIYVWYTNEQLLPITDLHMRKTIENNDECKTTCTHYDTPGIAN
jgi:hypothetical protein